MSSFSRNKPKIFETCGVLFAKVIDMTRLYILIFFISKNFPRSIWNSSAHLRKKGKEPIRYMVVRKKYGIHPKNFWTSQNFPESNASAPAMYFSLCRGYPLPFKKKCFWQKNACMFFCVLVLLFALVERLCFSHIQDFFIPYLRWKLVISYSNFQKAK